MDDADGSVVVEVDRPRVTRRDLLRLKTRLREDQHVRVDPGVEPVQQVWQVAEPVVVVERGGPRGDRLTESGDRVLERAGVARDRRVVGPQTNPVRLIALGCRPGDEDRRAERHAAHPQQGLQCHVLRDATTPLMHGRTALFTGATPLSTSGWPPQVFATRRRVALGWSPPHRSRTILDGGPSATAHTRGTGLDITHCQRF